MSAQLRASLPDRVATLAGLKAVIESLAERSAYTSAKLLAIVNKPSYDANYCEVAWNIVEEYISV
jgi:hypothetical protein